MKHVNLSLVKFFQFCTMFFFIFVVLFYFGTLLLLPLAAALFVNTLLEFIGLNGVFATFISIPIAIWLGYCLYQISGLFQTILDTGTEFIQLGLAQNKRFESIVDSVVNSTDETKASEPAKLDVKKSADEPPNKKP